MRIAVFAAVLLTGGPVLAADYGNPSPVYVPPAPEGHSGVMGDYEVRKYLMEDRRAYGGPGREYIRVTPWPPQNVLYVQGPRGVSRVVIDDRPPIWHPSYVPVLK